MTDKGTLPVNKAAVDKSAVINEEPISDVNQQIANSPIPSKAEVKKRSSLTFQTVRFGVLNAKILKLSRQHH